MGSGREGLISVECKINVLGRQRKSLRGISNEK